MEQMEQELSVGGLEDSVDWPGSDGIESGGMADIDSELSPMTMPSDGDVLMSSGGTVSGGLRSREGKSTDNFGGFGSKEEFFQEGGVDDGFGLGLGDLHTLAEDDSGSDIDLAEMEADLNADMEL